MRAIAMDNLNVYVGGDFTMIDGDTDASHVAAGQLLIMTGFRWVQV